MIAAVPVLWGMSADRRDRGQELRLVVIAGRRGQASEAAAQRGVEAADAAEVVDDDATVGAEGEVAGVGIGVEQAVALEAAQPEAEQGRAGGVALGLGGCAGEELGE